MLSKISLYGIHTNYFNQSNVQKQRTVAFKGLEQDVFTPTTKSITTQPLSDNEKLALNFGKDLKDLVSTKNATAVEIQKLILKHLGLDNVKIHSMSEYHSTSRPGIHMQKAAVTRPNFDANGKLINIDVFIPDVDYSDKNNVLTFVDKTVHEFTHIIQYSENIKPSPHYAATSVGSFMNFIQKRITDRLTDKGVTDTAVALIEEAKYPINNTTDFDNFMDLPTDKISPEKIGKIMKFGENAESQKQTINAIFDVIFDETLKMMQYEKDPNARMTIQIYGGIDEFKAKIKSICADTLKNEQEAYNAGNLMRKEINGVGDKQTYNDLISILMGMYSQALS